MFQSSGAFTEKGRSQGELQLLVAFAKLSENENLHVVPINKIYSLLNVSTGFMLAARTVCTIIVINAMATIEPTATASIDKVISIR